MAEDPLHAQAGAFSQYAPTILKGRNRLPIAKTFDGLFPGQDREIALIRFDLGAGKSIDLPLSEEALADLVHRLLLARGFSPETGHGAEYLRDAFSDE